VVGGNTYMEVKCESNIEKSQKNFCCTIGTKDYSSSLTELRWHVVNVILMVKNTKRVFMLRVPGSVVMCILFVDVWEERDYVV
jgi:hypothetical protein